MDAHGGSAAALDGLVQVPTRVADAVYEHLREAILAGALVPGQRLSIPELARRLDVSRSPVREAVQRLVGDGLARDEMRKGASVARLTAEEVAPLYEVREVLEGLAARLAADVAARDPAAPAVAELGEILAEHRRAVAGDDVRAHVENDRRFHAALRALAGNEELSATLGRIEGRVIVGMLVADHHRWPRQAVEEHAAIYAAVAAGDPEGAERAARAHIVRIRGALVALDRTTEETP